MAYWKALFLLSLVVLTLAADEKDTDKDKDKDKKPADKAGDKTKVPPKGEQKEEDDNIFSGLTNMFASAAKGYGDAANKVAKSAKGLGALMNPFGKNS